MISNLIFFILGFFTGVTALYFLAKLHTFSRRTQWELFREEYLKRLRRDRKK
jgi:hypothetical protein